VGSLLYTVYGLNSWKLLGRFSWNKARGGGGFTLFGCEKPLVRAGCIFSLVLGIKRSFLKTVLIFYDLQFQHSRVIFQLAWVTIAKSTLF